MYNENIFNKKRYKTLRQKLRKSVPYSEQILWQRLKQKQLGFKFRRQCGIGRFVVDFYCFSLKLVIEIDGSSHDGLEAYRRDLLREAYLRSCGLHIKRYSAKLVVTELDSVVEDVLMTCNALRQPRTTPSPS